MNIEKDEKGNNLSLVVPTKEEFDEWVGCREFTSLMELLEGYAILDRAHREVTKELNDPESIISDSVAVAMDDIEDGIFNLFVCAFKDFAAKKGGAK